MTGAGVTRLHPRQFAPAGASIPQRILAMSDERPYGCREWRARKDRDGYGRITIDGRTKSAHRAAYEAFVGPIPDGMTVDHLCFNRSCVEVAHLRLLTVSQNCANRQGSGAA